MRKINNRICIVIQCIVSVLIAFIVCFWVYPARNAVDITVNPAPSAIIRLWHIDSFEGGIGSRAGFLKRVAKDFEKQNGQYVLTTVHTLQSAEKLLSEGVVPDIISIGTYLNGFSEFVRPIPYEYPNSAVLNGIVYAVPWCRGNYFIYTFEGDFSDVDENNTLVSQGEIALPYAALYCNHYRGAFRELPSERAYIKLKDGTFRYMLGTQRDRFRLKNSEKSIRAKAVNAFNDLYQFICITAQNNASYKYGLNFVQYILSEKVQDKLSEIGMFSNLFSIYESDSVFVSAEGDFKRKTINAFIPVDIQLQTQEMSVAAVNQEEISIKKFENLLQ